jgi:Flp pilus assembly protein CpaB
LVAVAAVGTFAAASGAASDPRQSYVVARGDLAVGARISRSDLAVGRMDLPAFLRARAFGPGDVDRLVGAVVLGPVGRGELVQAGAVRVGSGGSGGSGGSDGGSDGDGRQVSFAIDPARAVGGALPAGEFVDVLATYGGSTDGYTVVVVRAARVAAVAGRGGLAGGDSLVVTLDVPSATAASAVAHAVDAGEVTLVRSGPLGPDETAPPTYRAPSA